MIKKTITFQTLDGESITEEWYFGLNEADIADLELNSNGAFSEKIEEIGKKAEAGTVTGAEVLALFKDVLMTSVGKRSEDGRRHIKNQDVIDDFVQTGAYSKLLMELVTDPTVAAEFINGIMPANVMQALADGKPITDVQLPEEPAWIKEGRVPTDSELKGATPEQLREAFRRQSQASN